MLWNINAIRSTVPVQSGITPLSPLPGSSNVSSQRLYYTGETYNADPTRVYAIVSVPVPAGLYPGVVLVHGGGETARQAWTEQWAMRGYVALAMDLGGLSDTGTAMSDGGPALSLVNQFTVVDPRRNWIYHAVANVIRATSVLLANAKVNADQVSLLGISWGGFIATIVAALDGRFRSACSVYGCGHVAENPSKTLQWDRRLASLTAEQRRVWATEFDAQNYLDSLKIPMLFIAGTTDEAFSVDIWSKTAARVSGSRTRLTTGLPHSQADGEAVNEPYYFFRHCIDASQALPNVDLVSYRITRKVEGVLKGIEARLLPISAYVLYTTAVSGTDAPWPNRYWAMGNIAVASTTVSNEYRFSATLPSAATAWFVVFDFNSTMAFGSRVYDA